MITTEEWKSVRASQKYPIYDDASCVSTNGVYLPDSFILDIHIVVPEIAESYIFYISKIYSNETNYCVQIAVNKDSQIEPVLWASVNKGLQLISTAQESYVHFYNIYKGEDKALSKVYGHCIFGATRGFDQQLHFSQSSTYINPKCISSAQNNGIQAIKVGNQLLTGIINLKGSDGIIISVQNTNCIKISLDAQYVKEQAKQYYEDLKAQYSTAITTINNVTPVDGNVNIIGLDCVKVDTVGNQGTITIANNCAKPCCTVSQEADNIQVAIDKILEQHQILKDYYTNQLIVINYMQTNLSTLLAQGVSK